MTISGMVESFEKYEVMEYLTNSGRESKQYVVWQQSGKGRTKDAKTHGMCHAHTSKSKLTTIIATTNCDNFEKNKTILKLFKFKYFHKGTPCLIML